MSSSLLTFLLAFVLPLAGLNVPFDLSVADAGVGCEDPEYAIFHPSECGTSVGCSDSGYAVSHPSECGSSVDPGTGTGDGSGGSGSGSGSGGGSKFGCGDPEYAITHPSECGVAIPPSDCSDPDYALAYPAKCGVQLGCDDNDYALTHPSECGQAVGCSNPDYAATHQSECDVQVSCENPEYAITHPSECGTKIGCEDPEYAIFHPSECGTSVGCSDSGYAISHPSECGTKVGCDDPEYAITNTAECGASIPAELPDLTAGVIKIFRGSTEVSASDIVEGDSVKFTSLISNTRPFAASTFLVNLTIDGIVVATENYASGLAGNSAKDSAFFWTAVAGTRAVKMIADSLEKIEETDEANNVATVTVTVKVFPPPACVPVVPCSQLGCGVYDSCGNFCGSCPASAVVDNAPTAAINVPSSAAPSSQLSIQVTGNDDKDVSQLLLYDGSSNLLESFDCVGVQTSCSHTFTATAPSTFATAYTFNAQSKDSAGVLSGFAVGSGRTTAAPVPIVCEEKFIDSYRCSGNDRQREKQLNDCTKQWVTLETCAYGCQQVWADTSLPVSCLSPPSAECVPSLPCSALGCGQFDSCGNFCGSCPASAVVDNAPTAAINVPSSAAPSSQLSIQVTGNDDHDVSQLQLYDANNNLLETFDCVGIQTSCSKTFTRIAPSAFSTSYTFKARSKDSAGQFSSAFVSGTGTTTAAPVVPPPVVPPSVTPSPLVPLQLITVKFPQQLFMRSVGFPDSDCVKPGESALLAVKVQNTGRGTLEDVSFAATVSELGIRASEGPVKLTTTDKSTRFFSLDIPEDAEKGLYYLRFSISNDKFSRAVHRTFIVDSRC